MTQFSTALLVFQGVVFLIWMLLAFRGLIALRADAVAESGAALPGPGWALRAFRGGLVDKRYAKDRHWLGILTLVLLGSSLVSFLC
ncbi:MAG: hypothetical protein WA975_06445 [Mesorhizobium sp.]